ncbi:MAG: thrombospondin type 3 repeat-containing protein [Oligoflexus sp.]|nr:thrombospondin type 3 repeat-containing protein [Oligoflexus sp.]
MNRLTTAFLLSFLFLASETSFAMCGTNICSAELPNDTDSFRAVGRISVLLTSSPKWSSAYSKDTDDVSPFDGSCECKGAQAADAEADLTDHLSDLHLTYDYYNVECFMVPAQGGSRNWYTQGRFSVGDTERTYNEWGLYFCQSNPFRFKFGTDLVDYRFEISQALMNDNDLDGLGGSDDHCDNSLKAGPNFGWDAHQSGTLLLGEEAGNLRGCFAPKEWPSAETLGSIKTSCVATVTGKARKAQERSEIFRMSAVAPSIVLDQGDELKKAAQTILNLKYESQGDVYAHCKNNDVEGPFSSDPQGKEYAEWQAKGACGGAEELGQLEFVPYVFGGSVVVICSVANDADGDGVGNEADICPMTPAGTAVYPDDFSDVDKRGCPVTCASGEEYVGGRCQVQCPGGSQRDGITSNCKCDDSTVFDPSAGNICEDKDGDKDGVLWPADQCPRTPFPAIVNAQGCEMDSDADSVADRIDHCPLTPAGSSVDLQGCALDSDGDGIEDSIEYSDSKIDCRNSEMSGSDGQINSALSKSIIRTRSAFNGKYLGCLRSQVDLDADGVANDIDLCSATPKDEAASQSCAANSKVCGCSFSDLDLDGDGVRNAEDLCPSSAGTTAGKGCASEDINALPATNACPVQSFDALTQDFYRQIVAEGQAANCQSPVDVIDSSNRAYGPVCKGTEGYYTYQLEKNLSAVVSSSADLSARSACYLRGHSAATIRSEYISPLYQDHHVKIWKNREQLQLLSGSKQYACSALLNDYNVHVSAYHGLTLAPNETLGGHDLGEAVEIFDSAALDVGAEAACGFYRPSAVQDPTHFLKLYP